MNASNMYGVLKYVIKCMSIVKSYLYTHNKYESNYDVVGKKLLVSIY